MRSTTNTYRSIFDSRSAEELRQLAHIKRFMERLIADPHFRDKLRDHADDLESLKQVTEEYGLDADPALMLPLFHRQYLKYRHTDDEKKWPLSELWSDYMREMIAHRDRLREAGDATDANPAFNTWRQRQIARSMSELGASGPNITHPLVAYELSQGCSMGCWFCGISAEKFEGHLPYTPESSALWRGVLETMTELFGMAAQTGFCYWATDPMDNPDYDRFIEDHHRITGFLPQTTTAAPLKNLELTRRVLALFDKHRCVTNRFSILNLKILDRVHATFTPEELMGVELVMQNREALTSKANAGRARQRKQKLREAGKSDRIAERDDDHATIACVSGFLINMLAQTVQMVSPTRGGDRWELGYRIYETAHFKTTAEFRAAIEGMLARHGGEQLSGQDRIAFRPDLTYHPKPDGFELKNATVTHKFRGFSFARQLGDLIADGDKTAGNIHAALVNDGVDVFLVAETLRNLFAGGLFDDDPVHGGIGIEKKLVDPVSIKAQAASL